jgi:hypothetical protein
MIYSGGIWLTIAGVVIALGLWRFVPSRSSKEVPVASEEIE